MNLVKHILGDAQRRLAVLSRESSLCDVARRLTDPETPLVVVCDGEGVAVGVVSSRDIVRAVGRDSGQAISAKAETVMTRPIRSCGVNQTLQSVWTALGAGSLRCIPVLDEAGKPLGVVHARDVARALFDEVANEEMLLRDYVLGIGYR